MTHPAALSEEALLKLCTLDRGRTSGPGGQHRNKVETWIGLTHRESGVVGQAGERRSRADNKRVALFRLRLALATQVRADVATSIEPSDLWRSRLSGARIACNPTHRDFPAMLAEAMDVIEHCGLQPGPAAERLRCSQSQLIKLVKKHPPAFSDWNRRRLDAGLKKLH